MIRALYTSDYIFYDSDTSLCAIDQRQKCWAVAQPKEMQELPVFRSHDVLSSVHCFFYSYVVLYLSLRHCVENTLYQV